VDMISTQRGRRRAVASTRAPAKCGSGSTNLGMLVGASHLADPGMCTRGQREKRCQAVSQATRIADCCPCSHGGVLHRLGVGSISRARAESGTAASGGWLIRSVTSPGEAIPVQNWLMREGYSNTLGACRESCVWEREQRRGFENSDCRAHPPFREPVLRRAARRFVHCFHPAASIRFLGWFEPSGWLSD